MSSGRVLIEWKAALKPTFHGLGRVAARDYGGDCSGVIERSVEQALDFDSIRDVGSSVYLGPLETLNAARMGDLAPARDAFEMAAWLMSDLFRELGINGFGKPFGSPSPIEQLCEILDPIVDSSDEPTAAQISALFTILKACSSPEVDIAQLGRLVANVISSTSELRVEAYGSNEPTPETFFRAHRGVVRETKFGQVL